MKKFKDLLFISFCCITFHASAQFSLGVKSGYIKAWQEYGDVDLPDNAEIHVNGFQISTLAYIKISKYISIGIEPGFTQRGAACIPGFSIFNSDTKFILNYVDLPLLISAKFPFYKNKLEVIGKAGFGSSVIITGFREVTFLRSDEPPVKSKLNLDSSSPFNQWDQGIYGGFGFAFNIGANKLFLESDFYYGLKDFDKFNTSKNRSIFIGLGYLISL